MFAQYFHTFYILLLLGHVYSSKCVQQRSFQLGCYNCIKDASKLLHITISTIISIILLSNIQLSFNILYFYDYSCTFIFLYCQYMFVEARKFSSDVSSWDVSGLTNLNQIFNKANVFNSDVSSWGVTAATAIHVSCYTSQYLL